MKQTKDDIVATIDIPASLGLLTRLPVSLDTEAATARGARAAWAYPLVGAVIGIAAAAVAGAGLWLGLPAPLAAVLFLATQMILTGAMHEDGLADTADGLWGGWTVEQRLTIMKDSQIGTYGTLALGLSLLARWSALSLILPHQLWLAALCVPVLSRVPMVALMNLMPNARQSGLSQSVGAPPMTAMVLAIGIGLLFGIAMQGWLAFLLLLIAALCTLVCGLIARAKIKGQTGDILGATQQVTEIALWFCLAASIGSPA